MKHQDLKVSFLEIVISIVLTPVILILINIPLNIGLGLIAPQLSMFAITMISLLRGPLFLLIGLFLTQPTISTSFLLAGTILVGGAYYMNMANFTAAGLFILALISGLLLLARLWYCSIKKQDLKKHEISLYTALTFQEALITILLPFFFIATVRFGLAIFGIAGHSQVTATLNKSDTLDLIYTTAEPLKDFIGLLTYLFTGLIAGIAALQFAHRPWISLSAIIAAFAAVSYGTDKFLNKAVVSRPTEIFIYMAILVALCAFLAYTTHKKPLKQSFALSIRNLATILMIYDYFINVITAVFSLFIDTIDSSLGFFSYLTAGLLCICISIAIGSTHIGIGFLITGILTALFTFLHYVHIVDNLTLVIAMSASMILILYSIRHIAKKKKK